MKHSKVVPIYKNKGIPNGLNNHRPITLQNTLAKVFEIVFADRLVFLLEKNSLRTPNQHGFRKGRSIKSAIYEAIDFTLASFDRKQRVLDIFFEFSKALDMIN